MTRRWLRTYVRYVVPFTLLSILAYAPLVYVARKLSVPATIEQARSLVVLTWILAAVAVVLVLGLVGAVAPVVRAVAAENPPSQPAALWRGLRGLVAAIIPVGAALLALAFGIAALVVPGLVLAPLVALTGASDARGTAARLADATAVGRARWRTVAITLVAIVVVAVILLVALQLWVHVPLPKKASAHLLANVQRFPRLALPLIALLAPVGATALASIYVRRP